MEAGLEHLSWAGGTLRYVDLLLVVVEAQVKVLLTAERTIALARQLGISTIALIGNRVRPGDQPLLESFAADHGCELLAVIPADDAIISADQQGVCPLDLAPDSAAVAAITDLAGVLESRFMVTAAV